HTEARRSRTEGVDPSLLKYLVRLVHTGAAAFMVGGAVLVWAQLAVGSGGAEAEPGAWPAALARRYEWGFWPAVGLLAMTGIGNLAVFGAALPGGQTDWGGRLLL
ncbi:MAG: hypothetical protein ACRDI2_16890, partial [Chloroflexota bacterium]